MARKVTKQATAATAGDPSPAVDSLQALNPDITVVVAGREVTFREYGFFDGLQVAARLTAFIADMTVLCADGDLRYARMRRLMGVHQATIIPAAALAAGVEPAWVRALKPEDAELFMSSWFTVHIPFFVHEAAIELREARGLQSLSTGSTPSPSSPGLASATSSSSDSSPSVN